MTFGGVFGTSAMGQPEFEFVIGKGDRKPIIRKYLEDEDGPLDLTAATSVAFAARHAGASAVIGGAAVIDIAADGAVSYTWDADDTSNPGRYYMQWTVTWSDGTKTTFPDQGADELWINEFWAAP